MPRTRSGPFAYIAPTAGQTDPFRRVRGFHQEGVKQAHLREPQYGLQSYVEAIEANNCKVLGHLYVEAIEASAWPATEHKPTTAGALPASHTTIASVDAASGWQSQAG